MATTTSRSGRGEQRAPRPFWRKHFFKLTLLPLGVIAAVWFLVLQPRSTKTVDEAFPTSAPARTAATAAAPAALLPTAAPAPQPTAGVPAVLPTAAVAPTAQAATAAAPAAASTGGPVAVKSGTFVKVEHDGSGKATIFKQADGTFVLRLENLDLTNGPDLRVRLLGTDGSSLDLGGLKGNKGNQTYELPGGFDPAKYNAADIWCRAFRVQFSKAALA